MAVGKYSPTVSHAYMLNNDWWKPAEVPEGEYSAYDSEGYDSYGYDKNNVDRAGNNEFDYMCGVEVGDNYEYPLYDNTLAEWGVDAQGKPCKVQS